MNIFKFIIILTFLIVASKLNAQYQSMPFDLSKKEIIDFKEEAKKGNVNLSYKLVNYYQFFKLDDREALIWLKQAIKNGSLLAITDYTNMVVERKFSEEYDEVLEYLKFTSSIGLNTSKHKLIKLCTHLKTCGFSKFYELVELTLKDTSEYSSDYMCFIADNINLLNNYEKNLAFSINQNYSIYFNKQYLCNKEYFSEKSRISVESLANKNLQYDLNKWFKFSENKNSKLTKQQDIFFSKLRKK